MHPAFPDPKKMVAAFLLLAIGAGGLSFVLIGATEKTRIAETASTEKGTSPETPQHEPFVESPSLVIAPQEAPGVLHNPTGTLTEAFVEHFSIELAKTNPAGPNPQGGETGLAIPSIIRFTEEFARSDMGRRAVIPDWEAEVRAQYYRVLTEFTKSDASEYARAVREILDRKLGSFYELSAFTLEPNDPAEKERLARIPVPETLSELQELEVPAEFLGFHRALIKMLIYEKRALALEKTMVRRDPVAASLILKAKENDYRLAIDNFQDELRIMRQKGYAFFGEEPGTATRMLAFLGVQTARAQVIAFDPSNLARMIWEFVQDVAVNILKDQLIHRLVKQTVDWIQGRGKPQFVTDWKGFLTGAADDAAGNLLYKYTPELCTSFGPLVNLALQPVNPARDIPVHCTLTQVVGNVQAFYDDFRQGGWIAYGASLEPQNNLFGSLFQVGSIIGGEAAGAREGSMIDSIASKGFLTTRECVEWELRFTDPDGDGTPASERVCVQYENTTPGAALANTVFDSMGAPIHRIVNANDIAALINALINAGLTKLIDLGDSGINPGLANLALEETDLDACAGLTGKELENCENGWRDPSCSTSNTNIPVNITNVNIRGNASVGTSTGGFSGSGSGSGSITAEVTRCDGAGPYGGPVGNDGSTGGARCGVNFPPPNCTCEALGTVSDADYQFTGAVDSAELAIYARACTGSVGLVCGDPSPFGRGRLLEPALGDTGSGATAWMPAMVAQINGSSPGLTASFRVFGDEPIIRVSNGSREEVFDVVTSQGLIWLNEKVICVPNNTSWP